MNKPGEEKVVKVEVTKSVVAGEIGLCAFLLFCIAVGIGNSPDEFDAKRNVCMPVSLTLYTNVGTQVLDKNSKPISCIPQ